MDTISLVMIGLAIALLVFALIRGGGLAKDGAYPSLAREGSWGQGSFNWMLSRRVDSRLTLRDVPDCWRAV